MAPFEQRTATAPAEQRTVTADLRDTRVEGRTLHGYAAVYGVESHPIEDRGRRFTEIIEAGAFADVLANGPDVYMCVNHDESRVLARTTAGTLRIFDEDRGLRFEADLGDGPTAQDVRDMVRRGDLSGCSFRFRVAPDGERWDGTERRALTRVERLVDLSLATTPAYDGPAVELRTQPQSQSQSRGTLTVEQRAGVTPAAVERRAGVTLAPEQRMGDWQTRRATRSPFSVDEAREFNLGRAVRGMVTGEWRDADLERRALAEGTNSAGGFLTPEILAAQVIDRIRNAAQVFAAGATTIPMDSDTVSIARLASGVTPQWKAENAAVAESDPSFERVTFTARTLPVLTRISMELAEDMTAAAADTIQNELVQAIALELDRAALVGSGTPPEPRGVRNQSGVHVTNLATNGIAPDDYSALVKGVGAIRRRNIQPTGIIMAPRDAETLALLTDTTGQPLMPPAYLRDVPIFETGQLPTDLDHGTADGVASEIFVGKWSDLLIGMRPAVGVRVRQLNDRFADNMQIGLLAWLRADVQVAHPQSFEVLSGVLEPS